ncbi:MAG: HAMP domain-containing histidine kinase [Variovorax sp.]|nr:MAG: HAMP domain-containing histidine kinase [Variovorax sp.]
MHSKLQVDQAIETAPTEMTAALYILVHDLCSPLQSLIASNESLSMQTLDEEGRQAVARIRRATQSLSGQLNDLTALARILAGDTKSHDVSFEVGALLQEVAAVGHRDLRVVVPIAPIFVRADAALVLQVLDRLVRTVVEASQAHATLVAEAVPPHGKYLSFRLQCADRHVLPSKVVQRLSLVRAIAAALKGDLETVLDDPSGLLFILRVAVQTEDPDALATS